MNDLYVVVHASLNAKSVSLQLDAATLGETLVRHQKKPRVYVGCMKSGPVLSQK